jgi:DNA-binding MarR family transcriptional regulator
MSHNLGLDLTKAASGQPNTKTAPPLHPHIEAVPIPFDLIELLFFAYRDFVSDPDRILEQYGFGRAHHRVLHFVNRRSGLTIATLLDILKITKQSLNRVLKELIEQGYIESRAGESDRRQRLLFPTARGAQLAHDLALLQSKRISSALEETGPQHREAIEAYLMALINPSERADIDRHIHAASNLTPREPPR